MIIPEISINWELSPRIIMVAAPLTHVSMQDLYDTLRDLEDNIENMDNDAIVSGSGKEPLGSGVSVGLTVSLLNARLAFEPRPGPLYVQCIADGGNLVAFDTLGETMSSIYPTAYTQVLLTSSSSATLQDLSAIQYSSYQNAVWVDTGSPTSGVEYPAGNRQFPVNNLADAISIANSKGFDTIQFLTDISINGGSDLNGFNLFGKSQVDTNIYISDLALVQGVRIEDCQISGILDGGVEITNCVVNNLTYVNGYIHNCGLKGYIVLDGSLDAVISDCITVDILNPPIIDMGGTGQNLSMPNYSGIVTLENMSAGYIGIGLNAGQVNLEPTISGGVIIVSGSGICVDFTTGTAVVNTDGLMSKDTIASAVYDVVGSQIEYASYNNRVTYDASSAYSGTLYPIGTPFAPVNNLNDALLIAPVRGFDTIEIMSSLTIPSGVNVDNYTIMSHNYLEVVVDSSASTTDTIFEKVSLWGGLSGSWNILKDCWVYDVSNFCGWMQAGSFIDLRLAPYFGGDSDVALGQSFFDYVIPMFPGQESRLVMNTPTSAAFTNLNCDLKIENMDASSFATVDFNAGNLIVDSTDVSGYIEVAGFGSVIGTTGGTRIDQTGFISADSISDSVYVAVGNEIEYASYQNAVWVATDGTTGTAYPIGTPLSPVNNMTDAHTIAERNGFTDYRFVTDWTFSNFTLNHGYNLIGSGPNRTTLTFTDSCYFPLCEVKDAKVTGQLKGVVAIVDALISDLEFVNSSVGNRNITIVRSLLDASITFPNDLTGIVKVLDSWSNVPGAATPQFNMNDSSSSVMFRNYAGGIEIVNANNPLSRTSIDLVSGQVKLKPSVTAGYYTIRGVGYLTDESSGTIVNTNGLMSKQTVAEAVGIEIGAEIQYANYVNAVWIDASSSHTGTTYPVGSQLAPVNNIADAVIIANTLGFFDLRFISDFTFDSSVYISDFNLIGHGEQVTNFQFNNAIVLRCILKNARATGSLTGVIGFDECHVDNLESQSPVPTTRDVIMTNTIISGTLKIPSVYGGMIQMYDCWGVPDASGNVPVLDMNHATMSFQMRNYSGYFGIKNVTSALSDVRCFLNSGGIVMDSTITAGKFRFTGVGNLTNNASSWTSLDTDSLISKAIVSEAVWDEPLTDHTIPGTTGRSLASLQFGGRVWVDPCSGFSGTTFPTGTQAYPVNNGIDARDIALRESITEFRLQGRASAGLNVTDMTIAGDTFLDDGLTFLGQTYDTLTFRDLRLDGSASFINTEFKNCFIENITGLSGEMVNCRLKDSIKLEPGTTLSGIEMVMEGDYTTIDLGNDPSSVVSLDINSGYVKFINGVAGSLIEVNLKGGEIELDPTIVGTSFYAEGAGTLYNYATSIDLKANHLLALETIPPYVWAENITNITDASSAGYNLWNMPKRVVNKIIPFLFAK